jgi:hypothetical protein
MEQIDESIVELRIDRVEDIRGSEITPAFARTNHPIVA